MSNGTLYIVGTPIGNLGDISERAIKTLKDVDLIACEDTRVTKKLLDKIKVDTKTISFHQHSDQKKLDQIIGLLKNSKSIALVTDAGTPGISDPGGALIAEAVKNKIKTIPIPGASALTAALSICGFPTDRLTFLGFPPNKKGRQIYFRKLDEIDHTIAIYESKHRILKALDQLPQDRILVVGRELTKLHETIYRGTASKIKQELELNSIKGEFVIVIAPKNWK